MNFGGRKDTNNTNSDCTKGALAVDAGYQPAKGQHVMAGVDSFGAVHKDGEPGLGAQLEFLRKF